MNEKLSLRQLLHSKYLYTYEEFEKRIQAPAACQARRAGVSDAFELLTPGGAPFLLGLIVGAPDWTAATEKAAELTSGSETIGLVAVYSAKSADVRFFRRRAGAPRLDQIPDLEYYVPRTSLKGLTNETLVPATDELPITNKLENLFFEIHSAMRDIDGLHADAALEELCKLLYVKAFMEEQREMLLATRNISAYIGSTEEYAASVRSIYRDAIDYDFRVYRLKIPQYERSRGVFQDPIRLTSAALARSFQLLAPYSLSNTKGDVKGRAFQRVLGRAIRSGMGQYFTPADVCSFIVEVLKPKASELLLDPFCGSGHFLTLSLEYVAKRLRSVKSKEFHEFAFGKLHGIEKSDRMTRIAMTDMRLNGDGHSNIRCTDSLLSFDNYPDIAPESFDVVLSNPPFGSVLNQEAIDRLGDFDLANGRKSIPLEILGLERAIAFLRPGGRIGIVLPDGIFSADSTSYVRGWLKDSVKVRAIVSLPVETFSPFGANVKTNILFARKWKVGEMRTADHDVCMIKVESVGYDAAGRATNSSDFAAALRQAHEFFAGEGW